MPAADKEVWRFLLLGPVVAAAGLALVAFMEGRRTVSRPWKPLLALGTISYAAYLWNYPIAVALPPVADTNMPLSWGLASLVLTVLMAALSWFTVEALGRAGRRWYDARSAARDTVEVAEPPTARVSSS